MTPPPIAATADTTHPIPIVSAPVARHPRPATPPAASAQSRTVDPVLGGFSLRGGEGSIVGVVLGTILLQVLQNLVNLLGIPSSLNFAVMGSVILVGVLADQQFDALRRRRALRAQAERLAAAE